MWMPMIRRAAVGNGHNVKHVYRLYCDKSVKQFHFYQYTTYAIILPIIHQTKHI